MSLKNNRENLIYLFIWIIALAIPVVAYQNNQNYSMNRVLLDWIRISPFLLIFLFNNYLLVPKWLFRKKDLQYLLLLSLAVVMLAWLSSYTKNIHEMFAPEGLPKGRSPFLHRPPPHHSNRPFDKPGPLPFRMWGGLMNQIIFLYLVAGFNTAIKLIFKRQEEEKNLEVQRKNHIQTELSLLKQQISPHFFMNTLNNIHALIDISSDEAKGAIIRLSKMMGYMLYDSQSEKVPVQKEMDFVRSYVDLMRIRFTKEIDISLTIPDQLPNVTIPPLLTISLIENAFKHGISYEETSFVHMAFLFSDQQMQFKCDNSVHAKKEQSANSGMGIVNTRNRLDLMYGDTYKLTFDPLQHNVWSVTLMIPL